MVHWIKKSAFIAGTLAFFIIFTLSIDIGDPFNARIALFAFIKAIAAASLIWLCAYVLADIVLKGVIEDIDSEKIDVLEDGLLQHVREEKEKNRLDPAAPDKSAKR